MRSDAINPPAIVVEDEQAKYQRLVMQGREAAALETEGKHANVTWVQALKAAYPDVKCQNNGRIGTSQKVFAAIMEVRGCTKEAAKQFIKRYKNVTALEKVKAEHCVAISRARQIRTAAVELATKYRLGADPKECMERLAKFIEDTQNG